MAESEWRVVPKFPRYEVSRAGQVRHVGAARCLPQHKSRSGPYVVLYAGKSARRRGVEGLVVAAWHAPEPEPAVAVEPAPVPEPVPVPVPVPEPAVAVAPEPEVAAPREVVAVREVVREVEPAALVDLRERLERALESNRMLEAENEELRATLAVYGVAL